MANPCLLHLPLRDGLDGRDRNGVVTATASGPVRFTADGYYAEEGTTNYARNPSAEDAITANTGSFFSGWSATGTGVTINPVETQPAVGSKCVEVVCDGAAISQGCNFYANLNDYTALTSYMVTPSISIRGSGVFRIDTIVFYTDASNASVAGSDITVPDDGEWHRYVLPTITTDGAKSVNYTLGQVRTRTARATTFWLDASQSERKAYATSYCDGSLGTGYSWAGTAHASASTRGEARFSIPTPAIESTGCIAIRRWKAGPQMFGKPAFHNIYFADETMNNNRLYIGGAGNTIAFRIGGNLQLADGTTGVADGADYAHMLITDWLAGGVGRLYVDTTLIEASPTITTPDLHATIGFPAYTGSTGSAFYSDVMVFDRPLTESERTNLVAMDIWSFDTLRDDRQSRRSLSMGLSF